MTRPDIAVHLKGATPNEFQSDIAASKLPEGPGLVVVSRDISLLIVITAFEQMLEQLRDLFRLAHH
jgi:hypothetical protein